VKVSALRGAVPVRAPVPSANTARAHHGYRTETVHDDRFRLVTLGRIALLAPDGAEDESLATRRRKLALLAVLAMAKRPLTRDRLVEMFWGDQDEARARHSLSDALSHIRRVLGRGAVATRLSEVVLTEEARLVVDAGELAKAAAAQDHARVVAVYGGPFLDGVHVDDSASFDHWVASERGRLEALFVQSSERQCLASARGRRWEECGAIAARWLEAVPMSADAALYRLNALKAAGTREADRLALAEYARLRKRLGAEYGAQPAPAVTALAESIEDRLAAGAGEMAAEVGALVADAGAAAPRGGPPPKSESSVRSASERHRSDAHLTIPSPLGSGPPPVPALALVSTDADAAIEIDTASTTGALTVSTAAGAPVISHGQALAGQPVYIVPATTEEWRALRPRVAAARSAARRRRRATVLAIVALAVLMLGTAAAVAWRGSVARAATVPPADALPRVAIMQIAPSANGDASGTAWVEEGLAQMVAAKLSRTSAVDVVPPERVREVKVRAELDAGRRPSLDRLLDLGRRLGATWIVTGTVTRGDSTFVLDVHVHDAMSGRQLQLDVVQGCDVLALADAAAARVLDVAGVAGPGPRLADVETASVEAYEAYTRAVLALSAGRNSEARHELDAALARDSGFVSAISQRLSLAEATGDSAVAHRLRPVLERNRTRLPEFDRLERELLDAFYSGEHERSEALGRAFVARYPRDPRAYDRLSSIYSSHGRWSEAEETLRAELALDSLALEAGKGACAPCGAYRGLVTLLASKGDYAGAEQAARRWVALQPAFPVAWMELTTSLYYAQKYDEALDAAHRMIELAGGVEAAHHELLARLLMARREYDAADSVIRAMAATGNDEFRWSAVDLRATLERERGQLRASNATIAAGVAAFPQLSYLDLVRGNTLGRLGDAAGAAQLYERRTHTGPADATRGLPKTALGSRGFVWHHVLLADAIAATGDTVRLRAIADSLDLVSRRSYYGRDWKMASHVRGLVAMRAGRYADAVRQLEQAVWIPAGWTRTNAELADAYLALGRPADALRVLRVAYSAPLDAMGRYLPHSELDYLMARAFKQAGVADSARIYRARVERAWREADPEVRRRLAGL
jgi:DNA-binding SARP family transcriptional activator/tetratricopeptide (TPR) repeat protein